MDIFDGWVYWLTVNRSQATLVSYLDDVGRWMRWGGIDDLGKVTRSDLERYLALRRADGVGLVTVRRIIFALRSLFGFAGLDVAAGLDVPRVQRRRQRVVTVEVVEKLLMAADTSTGRGAMLTALVYLLIDTGFRRSEVAGLDTSDLVPIQVAGMECYRVWATVKGGDAAYGVVGPAGATWLRTWLAWRADVVGSGGRALFVGRGGKRFKPASLYQMVKRFGQRAGVTVGLHDFRRGMITMALLNGAPSRVVQAASRHRGGLDMIELYSPQIRPEHLSNWFPSERLFIG